MRQLILNIPDNLDLDNAQVTMIIAALLYERGSLSLGQAAEFAGMSKRSFTESLGSYNISLFNAPGSELSNDVSNA